MFYYIEGVISHKESGLAVVDAGGVGYACNTSLNTLSQLEKGARARLYTYVHIREDVLDIYGFMTREELNCFKMLISISGVGPKAAVSILSTVTPSQLAMAVITDDEKALTRAQGIGKKIAQRIILELKDKMKKEQLQAASTEGFTGVDVSLQSNASEATAALGVLGYSQQEAAYALKGIDTESMPVEEVIRLALKNLAGGKL
ncbi:MAG: Holliday junction branch migration protein RuvA [Clostridiales bacterium]|nr:Holliday junction branch migration protein RuvA [Clostridiales bacterium]